MESLRDAGFVQGMSRRENCLDNACTEGLFGHMEDEFFQGGSGGLRSPLEHAPQAEEPERTDPGGIPESVLDGGIAASFN